MTEKDYIKSYCNERQIEFFNWICDKEMAILKVHEIANKLINKDAIIIENDDKEIIECFYIGCIDLNTNFNRYANMYCKSVNVIINPDSIFVKIQVQN